VVLNGFGVASEVAKTRDQIASEFGVEVGYSAADMTKPEAIAEMIVTTIAEHGRLDILVNNAGIQYVAPLDRFPIEKWDAILLINLSSAFHTTRLALPTMRKNKFGRIVNIASAHGLVASPFKAAYVAAKHGIVGLTKVAALETAEEGITCNAICPGYVYIRWSKLRSTVRPRPMEFPAKRSSMMCCLHSNPTSVLQPSKNWAR
jgi:3-hydroxybutyrate dehydrogenase